MKFKHFYSSDVRSTLREHRATARDAVMGIGSESNASLEIPNRRKRAPKITTVEQNSSTKKLKTPMTPSHEEGDDSGSDVVIISSSVIPKRKRSITSTPAPRSKRAKTTRTLSDEPKLSESEFEEDAGEDESEYGDEDDIVVDPGHKQKSAAASKAFASACKSCKSNANKALKAQYELQISKLKCEHKQEMRDAKAEKAQILAGHKSKANKEKSQLKKKYESRIEELKDSRDEKFESWRYKLKEATEEWQEKFDEAKKKVKKLTAQRDAADAKRKDIERSAADDIKAAKDDLKAGERKLREEKKQMMREKQEAIDILKPQHSAIVKEKDKIIRDMTDKVIALERDVQSGERAQHRVQTNHDTLLQRYQQLKTEHVENQKRTKQVEKDLQEAKKYAAGVDGRADVRLAQAHEKLEIQETNVREHANRVITFQRENHNLRDTLANVARLGMEKRDEVERLKAELQSTKAELGVVKDMEEMMGV